MKFPKKLIFCCRDSTVSLAPEPREEIRRHSSSSGQWKPSLSMISEDQVDLSGNEKMRPTDGSEKKKLSRKSRSLIISSADFKDRDYYRKPSPSLSLHSSFAVPYMF